MNLHVTPKFYLDPDWGPHATAVLFCLFGGGGGGDVRLGAEDVRLGFRV